VFPQGHSAGVEAVRALRRSAVQVPPVVFISHRGDFDARLEAVHAGAVAYFTKPVNVHGLADVMHELVAAHPRSPFRVLIVEDDAGAGRFYQATLERAGIGTRLVRDPSAIMEPLVDFRPELILMDLYLPECSGLDLAALLRQQEAYFNLPIIFVSPEDDADKRLAAIGSGADDYLTKPVDADYLTRLIGMRVRRYRRLERLIATDSLTGLLNQTAFMERLAREVARAGRRGDPLAVAMLDLDYFKQVNDTYGHLEGNNVLKTLALRLRRRLRAGDVVSRFGGEEFTIALVDTELETARRLLDRIREEFAAATHGTGERFRVTFSVGIAEYNVKTARSDHRTQALALLEQADKALYVAKRERNRVVVSPG
jgi:diguanylate cyclase (GGDEF)-like protein